MRTALCLRAALPLLLLLGALACSEESPEPPAVREEPTMSEPTIADVMAAHVDEWIRIPGVTAVYQSETEDGRPCIKIGVVEKTPELMERLPSEVDGHLILIEETGEIRPLDGS